MLAAARIKAQESMQLFAKRSFLPNPLLFIPSHDGLPTVRYTYRHALPQLQ